VGEGDRDQKTEVVAADPRSSNIHQSFPITLFSFPSEKLYSVFLRQGLKMSHRLSLNL
jgi:hypothetical protein